MDELRGKLLLFLIFFFCGIPHRSTCTSSSCCYYCWLFQRCWSCNLEDRQTNGWTDKIEIVQLDGCFFLLLSWRKFFGTGCKRKRNGKSTMATINNDTWDRLQQSRGIEILEMKSKAATTTRHHENITANNNGNDDGNYYTALGRAGEPTDGHKRKSSLTHTHTWDTYATHTHTYIHMGEREFSLGNERWTLSAAVSGSLLCQGSRRIRCLFCFVLLLVVSNSDKTIFYFLESFVFFYEVSLFVASSLLVVVVVVVLALGRCAVSNAAFPELSFSLSRRGILRNGLEKE